jgi:glycosyltransferase involved in cell wall biosynthesis
VFTTQKESSTAIALLSRPVRVHVVDPSAYTPPYDHALCRALGEAGAEVELHTSRFGYGPVAVPSAYTRHESFYRLAHRRSGSAPRGRAGLAVKLAEHVPDMLRYRRTARRADVVHFQWLTVQPLDVHLLPRGRPLVLTAHDVLPREPRPGQLRAQRRAYERVDAVVVHSEHGRARLVGELGLADERVHVIPHGVLRPWLDADDHELGERRERLLPPDLMKVVGPVVLFFGLMRPYKGLEVLLEAWRGIEGAELWIVGMPRMDIAPLQAAAPPGVRFVPRFVADTEVPAFLHRAYVVVLPYRAIDQSGAAFTALGAGTPLVLSDVGGFPELAATGAARLVPVGDPQALHAELEALLDDPEARAQMARNADRVAQGAFSWDEIARRTLALYESLR